MRVKPRNHRLQLNLIFLPLRTMPFLRPQPRTRLFVLDLSAGISLVYLLRKIIDYFTVLINYLLRWYILLEPYFILIAFVLIDELWKKFVLVALEFFCVAYLLLIIDFPSREGISELPVVQQSLKFSLLPAISRFGGVWKLLANLIGFVFFYQGLLWRAGPASRCVVFFEMAIFLGELAVRVMVGELAEEGKMKHCAALHTIYN